MRTLRYIILLLCWPIFATESLGQTPDSVYVDRHSLWRHTLGESLQNPAMMNHAYLKPFTELSILLDYRKQSEAFSLEQGTGFMMPEISARSYIRLTPSSVVWGEAAYSNGSHQISHLIMLQTSICSILMSLLTALVVTPAVSVISSQEVMLPRRDFGSWVANSDSVPNRSIVPQIRECVALFPTLY